MATEIAWSRMPRSKQIETTKSEKIATALARNWKLPEDPEFVGTGHHLRSRLFSLLGIDKDFDGGHRQQV